MSDPTLFGFLDHASNWLIPIATFAFGYATKGGANQQRLDSACASIASIQGTQTSDKDLLTRHQAILESYSKDIGEVKADVKAMTAQVNVLVARTQLTDSHTFRRPDL